MKLLHQPHLTGSRVLTLVLTSLACFCGQRLPAEIYSFTNSSPITVVDDDLASPYPSTISVGGITAPVSKVTVTLHGISHTYLSDVDVLLVAPSRQAVVLMSGAGMEQYVSNIRVTFDDSAPVLLPESFGNFNGTFLPTDYTRAELHPPAPQHPYATNLTSLTADSPNGDWQLFVRDSAFGDDGQIANGWELRIETEAASANLFRIANGAAGPELHYDFSSRSGLFFLYSAPSISNFFGDARILFTNDTITAPTGVVNVAHVAPGSAAFFSARVYRGFSMADWGAPIVDEEPPSQIASLHVSSTNYPASLQPGVAFPLNLAFQDGNGELQAVSGLATLTLIDASGMPASFPYSIAPASIPIGNGRGGSMVTITSDNSLADVTLGINFQQTGNAGTVAKSQSVPLPVLNNATRWEEYVDDTAYWYRPLGTAGNVNGTYGEWPGHASIHHGVDLRAPTGTAVYAAKRGVVCYTAGIGITIDHGIGYVSRYAHVQELPGLSVGNIVEQGDLIGHTGPYGVADSAAHLHFEIRETASPNNYIIAAQPGTDINPALLNDEILPGLFDESTEPPVIRHAFVRAENPGMQALSLQPSHPHPTTLAPIAQPYIIVAAADLEGGRTLAPQTVMFFDDDQEIISFTDFLSETGPSLAQRLSTWPEGGYARLPGDETGPSELVPRRYKFYTRWDTTKFMGSPNGPRTITFFVKDVSTASADLMMTFGPQLDYLPPSFSMGAEGADLMFSCRSHFGPMPNAPTASAVLDRTTVTLSVQPASDWSISFAPDSQVQQVTIDLKEFEYNSNLVAVIKPLKGSNSAPGTATIEASSLVLPNIRHVKQFDVKVGPAEGNVSNALLICTYSWLPPKVDLDTSTEFLGTAVGYACADVADYMEWTGDDVGEGGVETVTIDIARAAEDGALPASFFIACRAGWYAGQSSGPATLRMELRAKDTGQTLASTQKTINPGSQEDCASTPVGSASFNFEPQTGKLRWTLQ